MKTFDYPPDDDTGWWSPYVWPGADALMSWEAVGQVIVGAWLVLWWGLDDVAVWDALMYPDPGPCRICQGVDPELPRDPACPECGMLLTSRAECC